MNTPNETSASLSRSALGPHAATLVATLVALPGPSGPFRLSPGGDPARQAIQSHLYYTQFYKGRTDGHPDDERMDAAIKLVQIAAHLPVTGIFDNDVRDAIARFRRTQNFRENGPSPASPPIASSPASAMSPPRSLVRELATFAILTSPAWGFLLIRQLRTGARAR